MGLRFRMILQIYHLPNAEKYATYLLPNTRSLLELGCTNHLPKRTTSRDNKHLSKRGFHKVSVVYNEHMVVCT